jgi:hypothetical protein
MKNQSFLGIHARRVSTALIVVLAATLTFVQLATAENWNGIEPLKSRRADVERVLGSPIKDQPGETGVLHFKVAGGKAAVAFIDARFVAAKKLDPDLEGTVRQVVLQHESSNDTPESMGLAEKSDFKREEGQGVVKFTNLKDGIVYTFVGGRLRTSYFTPSSDQWSRAQRG